VENFYKNFPPIKSTLTEQYGDSLGREMVMRGAVSYKQQVLQASAVRESWWRRLRQWLGGSYSPYLFIAPFFLLFGAFGLYPLLYALNLSFTNWQGGETWRYIGLENYRFLLTDSMFWQSLGNSLYLWFAIVPVQTIFAVALAVLLSRPGLRLRWLFRTAFLTPYIVPIVAVAQVWLVFFDQDYGAVNTILHLLHLSSIGWLTTDVWAKPTLALLVLWKSSGFAILVMLAALQTIPQEYYEAASIDGAGAYQQFWSITLPLMRRSISFFMVISTLGVIQMFLEPFVLTTGGPYNSTTTAGYRLWTFIQNSDLGRGAANSFLLLIVVVAIALLMLRLMRGREEV
jgi:ABC-type sugar transport system permease subunit